MGKPAPKKSKGYKVREQIIEAAPPLNQDELAEMYTDKPDTHQVMDNLMGEIEIPMDKTIQKYMIHKLYKEGAYDKALAVLLGTLEIPRHGPTMIRTKARVAAEIIRHIERVSQPKTPMVQNNNVNIQAISDQQLQEMFNKLDSGEGFVHSSQIIDAKFENITQSAGPESDVPPPCEYYVRLNIPDHEIFVGNKHAPPILKRVYNDIWISHFCKSHHMKFSRGNTKPEAENYYYYQRNGESYTNIIDPPNPNLFKPITIKHGMADIWKNSRTNTHMWKLKKFKRILIHCDQGKSRSPSAVLCYLAHQKIIPNGSFDEARPHFEKLYPTPSISSNPSILQYEPGYGIVGFLRSKDVWRELMSTNLEEISNNYKWFSGTRTLRRDF